MDQVTRDARSRIFARLDLLAAPVAPAEVPDGPLAWLEAAPVICDFCRVTVTYADTKIETEPLDYGNRPCFFGMPTTLEIRVCSRH